eukprot:440350_1
MSFSIAKKRSFADSNEYNTNLINNTEPPTKKQKLNKPLNNLNMRSKLFTNTNDYEQFQTIFNSIDSSSLIKKLNISHFISKEIAEYSNGYIKYCANNECKLEIFILNKYIDQYDYEHKNSQQLGFKYCYNSNKYYCNKCMELAHISPYNCQCDEWNTLYFPLNCEKCTECDDIIIDNINCYCESNQSFTPIPCAKCNKGQGVKLCYDCHTNDYMYPSVPGCIKCGEIFCNDCIGYSEYNNCICKECEQNTNVKCGGNCENILNELCHYEFRYYDQMEGIENCNKCNNKFCDECYYSPILEFCVGCDMSICEKCDENPKGFDSELIGYVCNECYIDTVVACTKCNVKYNLFYESNTYFISLNGEHKMRKCLDEKCDKYICSNCIQSDKKNYFKFSTLISLTDINHTHFNEDEIDEIELEEQFW